LSTRINRRWLIAEGSCTHIQKVPTPLHPFFDCRGGDALDVPIVVKVVGQTFAVTPVLDHLPNQIAQLIRRTASRAAWTAGSNKAAKMEMMATTTINSMSVTALRFGNGLETVIGLSMEGGSIRPYPIKKSFPAERAFGRH
jgi:hypothetical protein